MYVNVNIKALQYQCFSNGAEGTVPSKSIHNP